MGADGFIVDPSKAVSAEFRCHVCGNWIPMYWITIDDHAQCIGLDGRLLVNVHIENYEERGSLA